MHGSRQRGPVEESPTVPVSGGADFEENASGQDDLAEAYVTMCVHAGIAAADVICCWRLNVHHQGESHEEAVTLLRTRRQTGN